MSVGDRNWRLTWQSDEDNTFRARGPHAEPQPCMCLWKILRVVRDKVDLSQYFCSVQVISMTTNICVGFVFDEVDGRESPDIEEVLDWYREEDVGDLRRNELSELVENITALKALERTFGKVSKVAKKWEQEQIVKNNEMNENS